MAYLWYRVTKGKMNETENKAIRTTYVFFFFPLLTFAVLSKSLSQISVRTLNGHINHVRGKHSCSIVQMKE